MGLTFRAFLFYFFNLDDINLSRRLCDLLCEIHCSEAPEKKMKLKQLEGLLGDLEQFSNPKVCQKNMSFFE